MFFTDSLVRRKVTWVTTLAVAWLTVGPSTGAWAQGQRLKRANKGHARTLTPFEMQHFKGQQGGGGGLEGDHELSVDPASGSTYPWEGNIGNTNTGNGNKLTEIPIVGWTARGGLPVSFSIAHNSQSTHNSELGYHWTHSFDIYLAIDGTTGDATIHWGNDLAYTFTKNINGSFTPPTGIHDSLSYNSGTSTYTLTTKGQVKYAFTQVASQWVCGTITDRSSNAITINHNSGAYVSSVVDPSGRTLSFSYNGSNQITSVTDPASRTFSFSYSSGNMTQVTYPAVGGTSPTLQFGYDASHRITSKTDPRGKVWSLTYNGDGSLASVTDPLSHTTTYTYAAGSTTVTDALSRSVVHNYSGGLLASVVAPGSSTTSFTYDSALNRTDVTDPLSNVTSLTYDSKGNVLTVTDALSNVTTYTYNSNNDVLTVTSPSGKVVTYSYDGSGRLTSVSDPLSHATTYSIGSYGLVSSVTNALSKTTSFTYDSYGNCTAVTDPLSHTTSTAYNILGMPTSVTDATSKTVSTSYDNLGRVVSVTAPGSRTTSFSYDLAGNKTGVTNALSQSQSFTYDDAGRLTSHTDALSRTVYFGYDAANQKTSFTDGRGKVTYYSYTTKGQLSEIDYPDSTSQTYSYDAAGRLYTKTDGRGVSATYSYDDAGRLTGIDYSDSTSDVTFAYNSDGLKTSMVDGSGTTTYSYDSAFRLTSRAAPQGTTSYSYTNADQVYTRSDGTTTAAYSYDDAGRTTSVVVGGSQTTSYSYDNANRLTSTSLPDGSTETRSYNSTTTDLTSVVSAKSGTTISSSTYSYDSLGRKTDETTPSSYTSYTYDAAGQLTGDVRTGTGAYSISYTYDSAGNRATKVLGGVTENYTYDDANKLTATTGKSYSYDDAGNCTGVTWSGGSISLSWDAESRLKSETTGGTTVNYAFNGLGQRVGKSGGVSASYILADDGIDSQVLADGSASYAHGVTGLISENRGGTSKFYHPDALGSVRALTNTSGTVTDSRSTDAFGLVVASSGSTPTPFGFAGSHGYQQDSETGLMRLGHRMYDASTGRFISRDPIQDGYNWYAYCDSDPVNAIDPEGKRKVTIDGVQFNIIGFTDEMTDKVIGQLISISHTDTGDKLLKIIKRRRIKPIITWDRTPVIPDRGRIGQTGGDPGTTGSMLISYDPETHLNIPGKGPGGSSLPFHPTTILIHELGHVGGYIDPGGGILGKPAMPGDNVFEIENKYRREVGLPRRMVY